MFILPAQLFLTSHIHAYTCGTEKAKLPPNLYFSNYQQNPRKCLTHSPPKTKPPHTGVAASTVYIISVCAFRCACVCECFAAHRTTTCVTNTCCEEVASQADPRLAPHVPHRKFCVIRSTKTLCSHDTLCEYLSTANAFTEYHQVAIKGITNAVTFTKYLVPSDSQFSQKID